MPACLSADLPLGGEGPAPACERAASPACCVPLLAAGGGRVLLPTAVQTVTHHTPR